LLDYIDFIKYSVKSLKFMDSNIRVLSKKNFIFVDVQIRWSPCCSQYAHILWQIFVDFFISRFDGVDGVMVFNATFNNISVVSWRSVSLVGKTRVLGENHRPVARHWQTLSHNVVSSTPRQKRGSNSQL
jgi:hypothetical protein